MFRRFYEKYWIHIDLRASERMGFAVIMGVLVLLCAWIYYEQVVRNNGQLPEMQVEEYKEKLKEHREATVVASEQEEQGNSKRIQFTLFNPNNLTLQGWQELGFSEKQAASIVKYQAKGGVFRTKRDVARMYVISEEKYATLAPYIDLPEKYDPKPSYYNPSRKSNWGDSSRTTVKHSEGPRALVDINSATAEELEALPNVGPTTAKQIIAYRKIIGGYVSTEQLSEVYQFQERPETLAAVLPLVVASSEFLTKLNLNSATVDQLAEHRLINWKQAHAIVNYRAHHGAYTRVAEVMDTKLIDEDLFRRLAPYLTIE